MAWGLTTAVYDSVNVSVAAQTTSPRGLAFGDSGAKMYVVGGSTVYQYTLSTPWDLSSASYASISESFAAQDASVESVFFKSDGTKCYVLGGASDTVYQYSLGTAWNVSTSSYDSVSLSVTAQDNAPLGLFFGDSGAKMFVVGTTGNKVLQYDLGTPWDLSTASYSSKSITVTTQTSNPQEVAFDSSGTKVFVLSSTAGSGIIQYELGTAWDLDTESHAGVSFDASGEDTSTLGLAWKDDGTKFYIAGNTNDRIYQYSAGNPSGFVVGFLTLS